MSKFGGQYSSLQSIYAAVYICLFVVILLNSSMIGENSNLDCQFLIIGNNCACVPVCA